MIYVNGLNNKIVTVQNSTISTFVRHSILFFFFFFGLSSFALWTQPDEVKHTHNITMWSFALKEAKWIQLKYVSCIFEYCMVWSRTMQRRYRRNYTTIRMNSMCSLFFFINIMNTEYVNVRKKITESLLFQQTFWARLFRNL